MNSASYSTVQNHSFLPCFADIRSIEPLRVVQPFLAVIQSPLASGPITALALTSLHTLASHILPIYINSAAPATAGASSPPNPLQTALSAVTTTVSHCRFPSSSPAQDEVVLLRLLRLSTLSLLVRWRGI